MTQDTYPTHGPVALQGRVASSASRPFWAGRTRTMDTEGRVEAFRRRCGRSS